MMVPARTVPSTRRSCTSSSSGGCPRPPTTMSGLARTGYAASSEAGESGTRCAGSCSDRFWHRAEVFGAAAIPARIRGITAGIDHEFAMSSVCWSSSGAPVSVGDRGKMTQTPVLARPHLTPCHTYPLVNEEIAHSTSVFLQSFRNWQPTKKAARSDKVSACCFSPRSINISHLAFICLNVSSTKARMTRSKTPPPLLSVTHPPSSV